MRPAKFCIGVMPNKAALNAMKRHAHTCKKCGTIKGVFCDKALALLDRLKETLRFIPQVLPLNTGIDEEGV